MLVLHQLKKKGWRIPNRCYKCKKEDTVDHIVLHCSKVVILWMLVNALLGVWGMMHSSVRDTLLNWHESFVKKKTKKAGKVAPLYLF